METRTPLSRAGRQVTTSVADTCLLRVCMRVVIRVGGEYGALGGIRTPDPRFRRPMLYPLSYERTRAFSISDRRARPARYPPAAGVPLAGVLLPDDGLVGDTPSWMSMRV